MKKTCIVTGGSSGIGLSIVQLFARKGYRVFNLDIQPCTIAVLGSSDILCDMSNTEQVSDIINNIAKTTTIDVLVSNAGIHFSGNIENTSEADFDKVLNINVYHFIAA